MGLADDVAAATRRRGGYCAVSAVSDERPDLAAELRALIDGTTRTPEGRMFSGPEILAGLRANGVAIVGLQALQRHRRRECKCP